MKNILLISFFVLGFYYAKAQVPIENKKAPNQSTMHDKREKVEAMKIGYLTEQLNLSPAEAQKFWPVYNEFQQKQQQTKKSWRQFENGQISPDDLSDEQLNELMLARIESKIDEAQLEKQYHQKFIDVLGIPKTAQLYKAENDFKRELLKQIRDGKP